MEYAGRNRDALCILRRAQLDPSVKLMERQSHFASQGKPGLDCQIAQVLVAPGLLAAPVKGNTGQLSLAVGQKAVPLGPTCGAGQTLGNVVPTTDG